MIQTDAKRRVAELRSESGTESAKIVETDLYENSEKRAVVIEHKSSDYMSILNRG